MADINFHISLTTGQSHWTQIPNNPGDREQRWTVSHSRRIYEVYREEDAKLKKKKQKQPKPVLNVAEATTALSSYKHPSKITGGIFFLGYNILLPSVSITNTYL